MMMEEGEAQNMKEPNKKNYAKPTMERWGDLACSHTRFIVTPQKTTSRIVEKGNNGTAERIRPSLAFH